MAADEKVVHNVVMSSRQGMSRRAISRALKVSRNTIRKILDGHDAARMEQRSHVQFSTTVLLNVLRCLPMRAGFAKREITPALGTPLAGRLSFGPRRARHVRDPLFVRALHVEAGGGCLTLIAVDLVLVTARLHRAVAAAAGLAPERLLLCATHTHSGPGGYWRGSLIGHFMGAYNERIEAGLVAELGTAARTAAAASGEAILAAVAVELAGAGISRRHRGGAVDSSLSLLEIEIAGEEPVSVVVFGAHPTAGVDAEPATVTADYPGDLCRRLESRGRRALFLQGAAAGTAPGFPPAPLGEHIARMGDVLEAGVEAARRALAPVAVPTVTIERWPLAVPDGLARMVPGRALDTLVYPLRALGRALARQGRGDNAELALHRCDLGGVTLLGVPAEVGPGVSAAVRGALRAGGAGLPVVVSMCGGYAGYVHRRDDYEVADRLPLTLYENLMGAGGWDLGEHIVDLVASRCATS
jgi:hypothetical protein